MNPESEQWSAQADRDGKLNILNVFLTVDGEANAFHVGEWSVFVRLTGCRVGCVWCDTKYSWSIKQGELLHPVKELLPLVKRVARGARKITITGGEPMEQNQGLLADFVNRAVDFDFSVSIETAGTEPLHEFFGSLKEEARKRLSMVLDYKLPASRVLKPFNWGPYLQFIWQNDVVKFVVADSKDYEHMITIATALRRRKTSWGRYPRFVASPLNGEGTKMSANTLTEMLKRDSASIARCIGVNLQTHKYIYPADARDEEEGGTWQYLLRELRSGKEGFALP